QPDGVEVAALGKRVYRDELALVDEDFGPTHPRRLYRLYGDASYEPDEVGTDLAAVASGKIAVTPTHFYLPARDGPVGPQPDHPELVTPDSPTQRIGGEPVSDLVKVSHPQAMLSLANARSADELRAWIQRMRNHLAREGIEDPEFEYVVEPKIDGLAISLLYRDGIFERGATRGNGEIGEDVTHNLRTMPSI